MPLTILQNIHEAILDIRRIERYLTINVTGEVGNGSQFT
jgi:hypothetical protein